MWNTNDKANKSQVEKVKLDSEMLLFPDLSLVLKFHWNKVESNWSLKLFKAVLYCLGKMARVKRFNQNLKMWQKIPERICCPLKASASTSRRHFCTFVVLYFLNLAHLYSFTFCTIYVVQCTQIHHQKPPTPLWLASVVIHDTILSRTGFTTGMMIKWVRWNISAGLASLNLFTHLWYRACNGPNNTTSSSNSNRPNIIKYYQR